MRTDRTQLCASCALRMSRRERACPMCQGTLHDLTVPSHRASALRLLAGTSLRERIRRRLARFETRRSPARLFFEPGTARRRVSLLPEGKAPDGPIVIRGRVRVTEPGTSPVGGEPCAAWRVVGRATDDAWMTTFEVVGDPGGPVRVEASTALVILEPTRRGLPVAADAGWLAARLIPPDAELEEGILADGDEVTIHARELREEPGTAAAGFRQAERIRVVHGTAQHPLLIVRG